MVTAFPAAPWWKARSRRNIARVVVRGRGQSPVTQA